MSLDHIFDAVIVGAGLAGSAAACHLARLGYSVLVLEREEVPKPKVCGEYFSAECIPLLREIGVAPELLGAVPIDMVSLHASHTSLMRPLKKIGFGLSRTTLDQACLEHARQIGAQALLGVAVTDIQRGDVAPFLVKSSSGEFFAHSVFVATGKHDTRRLRQRVGRENSAIGFKTYLHIHPERLPDLKNRLALFLFPTGYAGLVDIEGGLTNFCFIVDKKTYRREGSSFKSCRDFLLTKNHALRDFLQGSVETLSHPLTVANIPYGFLESTPSPLYFLGDQFAVMPSLSGTGLATALLTAKMATLCHHADPENGAVHYHEWGRQIFAPKLKLSYPLHQIFKTPILPDALLTCIKSFPQILDWLIEKTRVRVFLEPSNVKGLPLHAPNSCHRTARF